MSKIDFQNFKISFSYDFLPKSLKGKKYLLVFFYDLFYFYNIGNLILCGFFNLKYDSVIDIQFVLIWWYKSCHYSMLIVFMRKVQQQILSISAIFYNYTFRLKVNRVDRNRNIFHNSLFLKHCSFSWNEKQKSSSKIYMCITKTSLEGSYSFGV